MCFTWGFPVGAHLVLWKPEGVGVKGSVEEVDGLCRTGKPGR